jgi:pilus assembly protein Flp/PilA
MRTLVSKFMRDESGATAIEYGLIAALISVVIIATLTLVGGDLQKVFTNVDNGLKAAG